MWSDLLTPNKIMDRNYPWLWEDERSQWHDTDNLDWQQFN